MASMLPFYKDLIEIYMAWYKSHTNCAYDMCANEIQTTSKYSSTFIRLLALVILISLLATDESKGGGGGAGGMLHTWQTGVAAN